MAEAFTVFVTKHAITEGILKLLVTKEERRKNMVRVVERSEYYHKDEWFLTLPEAQAYAEKRRDRKRKSLERQIIKLANLDYSKPTNLVGNIKAQDRPRPIVSIPSSTFYDLNPRYQHLL